MGNFIVTCQACSGSDTVIRLISGDCSAISPCTGQCFGCLSCPTNIPNLYSISISQQAASGIRKGGTLYWTTTANGGTIGGRTCPSCNYPGGQMGVSSTNCDWNASANSISCTPGTFTQYNCLHSSNVSMYLREVNGYPRLFLRAGCTYRFNSTICQSAKSASFTCQAYGISTTIPIQSTCTDGMSMNIQFVPFFP